MGRQKRTKIITTTLICLAAISLAAFNYYQYRRIHCATGNISPGSETSADNLTPSDQIDGRITLKKSRPVSGLSNGSPSIESSEADELIDQISYAEEELSILQEQLTADEEKKQSGKNS